MAVYSTWDTITVLTPYNGEPKVSFSSPGCGCCSDCESHSDPDKAIAALEDAARDFESMAQECREWANRIKIAGKVVE